MTIIEVNQLAINFQSSLHFKRKEKDIKMFDEA